MTMTLDRSAGTICNRRPVGIDLFAGAGGLSLGFEQAGFDVVAAVEIDPIHAATHAFNFPNCKILPRSVEDLSAKDILTSAGLKRGGVDVVFGGAPCQGFSLIGKRALDDPRNALVREFIRIVVELESPYFLFENVKGLTLGSHKVFLEELLREFESAGYDVRLPWRVLNASHYGVPQNRERLFLIGARRGQRLPPYPNPTTRPAGTSANLFGLPEGPSCLDALSDLPDAEDFDSLWTADSIRTTRWGKPSRYAQQLRCTDGIGWFCGYTREWDPEILTASIRSEHTDISRRRFSSTIPGTTEPVSRFYKLSPDGVCNTLRAGTDSARGAFTSPRPIHYSKPRCITVREMARLHGFPDWFRPHVTKWHGARQIGNAVAPPIARELAREFIVAMGLKPQIPKTPVQLGDVSLLTMTVSEAASYWGIDVPRQKRGRKSGAKNDHS
jgi:DNA (cytosine-5)-methyltransferase 1